MLKWVGGIVTVISLVLGVRTLLEHYDRWQEERAAIDELVSASEWLSQAGNQRQAWTLLERANELSPSSLRVRSAQATLAMTWLRDFRAHREEAAGILDSLTEVLYRQLSDADADKTATVLGHAGRAEVLRLDFGIAAQIDPDELIDQALEANPKNGYANTFKAHWLLVRRPIEPQSVEAARPYFDVALESDVDRTWVRSMQMQRLGFLSERGSDETQIAATRAFLLAARDMMEADEPLPHRRARADVLESYGFMGRGDQVEALLDVLPPDEYLRVLDWLRDGLELSASQERQQEYLDARLAEVAGRKDEALEIIRGLMAAEGTSDRLQPRLDQDVLRMTGALPPRALARKYKSDPVDESDPFGFHLETLQHFDPKWLPENRQQALEFFSDAAEQRHERLPELLAALPAILDRVMEIRRAGDERAKFKAFTTGYSAWHYQTVRDTLAELIYLRAAALRASDDIDAAIAVAGDLEAFVADLDDHFDPFRAGASWQLAIAHAQRAARDDSAADREAAIVRLEEAISRRLIDFEIASWQDIKSDLFAGVANEPAYLELVRGR